MSESMMRLLASAIFNRAVEDYRKALSLLQKNPEYTRAIEMRDEIEEFFDDEWFDFLCGINPEILRIYTQEVRG